jgi:hypothetical protein
MTILLLAVGFSALVLGSSALFQISQRRLRAVRFRALTLKPNVLLTRYPITFLSGPRTVFRFFDHWNDIPLFLREHGYEVYVIEPTGRTPEERLKSVCSALESMPTQCHLVADGSLEQDMQKLANLRLSKVSSFTVVKSSHRERSSSRPTELSINDLKPLAKAVEFFEVPPVTDVVSTTSGRFKLILLGAHNFLIKRRTFFVHPFETAEIPMAANFKSEERFLDLAISLAERDLIGSDERHATDFFFGPHSSS